MNRFSFILVYVTHCVTDSSRLLTGVISAIGPSPENSGQTQMYYIQTAGLENNEVDASFYYITAKAELVNQVILPSPSVNVFVVWCMCLLSVFCMCSGHFPGLVTIVKMTSSE